MAGDCHVYLSFEFDGGVDMRKCIRCEIEMKEDYDVKVEGGAYGLIITIHNLSNKK